MSLLREIQGDLSNEICDVTTVLRKCKILAARLGSEEFSCWVDWELNGYPDSQPLPDYRCLGASCYASFMNAGWRVEGQAVLWEVIPQEAREALQNIQYREGIAKAKGFVQKGCRINRPDVAIWLQGKMFPGLNCFAAWLAISGGEFEQLFSAIKNRILDFVLKIEAENPDAGEAAINSEPVPAEKLQSLVNNNFYAPVGNVAQHGRDFSQISSIGVQLQDLGKLVREVSSHLDELKLSEQDKRRAEAQISALKAELAGEPDPVIVKQAGTTLRNITEGAIGSLLASAAQPTIWHWIHQTLTVLAAAT